MDKYEAHDKAIRKRRAINIFSRELLQHDYVIKTWSAAKVAMFAAELVEEIDRRVIISEQFESATNRRKARG